MKTFDLERTCENCGTTLEQITNLSSRNRMTAVGDPIICVKCGSVTVYQEDKTFKLATQEDWDRWEGISVSKTAVLELIVEDLKYTYAKNS